MSSAVDVSVDIQPRSVAKYRNAPPTGLWSRLTLAGVMLISIFMNFYQLGQNGFGNLYYAAGVRSMLDNCEQRRRASCAGYCSAPSSSASASISRC